MTIQQSAKEYMETGTAWTHRLARLSMPILLWAANNNRVITYGQLAEELERRHGEPVNKRMTLYGKPAGKIGYFIERLWGELGTTIPPLNAIIVNKSSGLPGNGVDNYVRRFLKKGFRKRLTEANKRSQTQFVVDQVLHYNWREVIDYLGITDLPPVSVLTELVPIPLPPFRQPDGSYGESDQHKNLKEWAKKNPKHFARFGKFAIGKNEYLLASGDRLDVYFEKKDMRVAVEVKASNAPESELYRGVFQCVKYRATLEAMGLANAEFRQVFAVLLTTARIPAGVYQLARRLNIEIMKAPLLAEK